ncbi:MAG: hypothetical protein AVDCRST_MAG66-3754 [uncultured Pseudonocardia sp.]|uniref:Lipocalin-like domain-containing protein n=1 Tax=uncultured Pseudonocardia sp. TaxID=211455 RepID=A0A6J4QAJ6_9PSEU|nr:MAG: hypothetical protein AVDCRST_MAG66-3754 [uncultured Pseudonocardia sp.]
MSTPVDVRLLCRSWLRSRREDSEAEEVYRPAESTAPRRERSVSGYQFNADGTVKRVVTGMTDVPAVTSGVWQVDDEHPDRVRLVVGGQQQVLEIADLTADRLAVRRMSPAGD